MKQNVRYAPLFALFASLSLGLWSAYAQGTAFTYQGQLQNSGSPASGTYNLSFTLFPTNTGGTAVAGPVTTNGVIITNGLFTVIIDFGPGVFSGTNYWLEIGVETNGASPFTTLSPRQPLTPVPYAIYAESVTASGISGTLTNAQLLHSAVTVNPGPGLSGGGKVTLGNTITLTNTGVLSVTGNADITASTVGGAVTLGDTATSTDTASTLVKRDSTGSFSAASITLDGTLTLPTITAVSPDIIYSGSTLLLYDDNNGNSFSGNGAGGSGTSGFYNTAIGSAALVFIGSGSYNTAAGSQALYFNSGGSDNTAVGFKALTYSSSSSDNTAIGYEALLNNMGGSDNTANGSQALYSNTSGSDNTAVGFEALLNNSSGSDNTAVGFEALSVNSSGSDNTANGYEALYLNTSGSNNTASGSQALYSNTSGSENTAIGVNSLEALTTGSNNIALGYLAGAHITTGSGNIDIGNGGVPTDTNIIRIGSGQTQTYIAGVLLPPSPVIIQTNFIDGQRYTNNYGWPLMINASVVLNTAAVTGSANESLCIEASPSVGGVTNLCAISTLTTSAALHYTNHIGGFVPTNAIYWFTNLSTGSGNSASVTGGQIKYP
jgi:hypothetical protein